MIIASLKGKLQSLDTSYAVVECAGVGYQCAITLKTYEEIKSSINNEVFLLTHLHISENYFGLFGFFTENERSIFRMLISISGVGPKIAINILSCVEAEELVELIRNASINQLVKIPNIGKSKAEKLVFELRDKMLKMQLDSNHNIVPTVYSSNIDDAILALIGLGYNKQTAEKAVDLANKELNDKDVKTDVLIIRALKFTKK